MKVLSARKYVRLADFVHSGSEMTSATPTPATELANRTKNCQAGSIRVRNFCDFFDLETSVFQRVVSV
jgi:hypothetical protein